MTAEFRAWPSIPRLYRDCVITEKIDGTNAAVVVTDDGQVYAQSRKRVITRGDDNRFPGSPGGYTTTKSPSDPYSARDTITASGTAKASSAATGWTSGGSHSLTRAGGRSS